MFFVDRPTQDLAVQKFYVPEADNQTSVEEVEQGKVAYSRLVDILSKKIVRPLAKKNNLNFTDLRIDDLFLTKYDADLPPKHMLGPHRYERQYNICVFS